MTYNLSNIALLYGGAISYDTCKHDTIEETMHEFKNKKLKTRANKTVTDKDQAIAIALSQVHSNCKRNKIEEKKLIDKVNRDLNDSKELNLTDVIETYDSIKILNNNSKHKQVYMFKKLLWDKIIKQQINSIRLDKNMWEEIKKIHEL
jgi:hypothetical protein